MDYSNTRTLKRTLEKRPDLLHQARLTPQDEAMLKELKGKVDK